MATFSDVCMYVCSYVYHSGSDNVFTLSFSSNYIAMYA